MVEERLKLEIEKWTQRLEERIGKVSVLGKGEKLLENILAYRADSKHFFQRGDLVKSFECLIWAWALLDTGKELGHLTPKPESTKSPNSSK